MSRPLGFKLNDSVKATSLPPLPIVAKWASEYKDTGLGPLIDLSQGLPGSQPHPSVSERLSLAVRNLDIGGGVAVEDSAAYGDIFGDLAMREALVEEMKHVYSGNEDRVVDVKIGDVAMTAGCNAAFMIAVMAIAERGDEVILPVPWYFNHQMTLQMLGVEVVPLPISIESGFVPKVDHAEALITSRTRAIALVSPNNPTGVAYPPSLLQSFAHLASKHNIALILDETYRDFVEQGPPHDLFTPRDGWDWRSTLVHLFSFSKSYRVPGHRLGAIAGGPALLENIAKVVDCMQICPSRPLQIALPKLLPSLRPDLAKQSAELSKRHVIFRDTLQESGSGWRVGSSGAYFALVRHPFRGVDSEEVCRRLAGERGVLLLPLSFFAPPQDSAWSKWIRVSVANVGPEAVQAAARRMVNSGAALGWERDDRDD